MKGESILRRMLAVWWWRRRLKGRRRTVAPRLGGSEGTRAKLPEGRGGGGRGESVLSHATTLAETREGERGRPQQPLFSLSLRERVYSTSSRGEESGGEDPGKKERRGKRVAGGVKGVRVSPEKGVCVECAASLSAWWWVSFGAEGGKRAASKSAQTFLPPSLLRK